jgi:hypothetical protein
LLSQRLSHNPHVPTRTGALFYFFTISAPGNELAVFQVDPKTLQPIPAHADTLWEVEVKTAEPIRNTPETPLSAAIEEALEIQLLMKGLLDLRRQDI